MLGCYKMSIAGPAHQEDADGVCQDASDAVTLGNGWMAAAVADGLGSASRSELGSAAAVEAVLSYVTDNCPDSWDGESLKSLLEAAYHEALQAVTTLAEENQNDISDYDTTLTTVIYDGTNAVYGHVGDGGIIALSPCGDFSSLTQAQKGEAFNETIPLRAGPEYWDFGISVEDVCALALLTDGLYDIVKPWQLKDADQQIYVNFIRPFMDINVLRVSTPEDFEAAQAEMIEFLKGPYTRRIMDDKTIVGLINTDVVPEIKPEEFYREPDWEALKREHDGRLYEAESRQ